MNNERDRDPSSPNGLGNPTATAAYVCRNSIERRLCLNRRGGVAPPLLYTNLVALPNLIIRSTPIYVSLNIVVTMKSQQNPVNFNYIT